MKLAFDDWGKGEAVLLVHGLGGSSNIWAGQTAALARHFRVIAPDLRGSGRSACCSGIAIDAFAADCHELLQTLSIEQAHLVGHSMGCMVVQHMAASRAGSALSLSLIGPLHRIGAPVVEALQARAAAVRADGLTAVADATVNVATSALTRAAHPELAGFVREMIMRQDPESYAGTCEAIATSVPAALDRIDCPALVITGDEDATSPPLAARAMAQTLSARFEILPSCGHWAPVERAAAITEILENFLLATS